MNLIIYQADVVGKQNNCLYPHRREVTNADELAVAVAMEHGEQVRGNLSKMGEEGASPGNFQKPD